MSGVGHVPARNRAAEEKLYWRISPCTGVNRPEFSAGLILVRE